MPLQQQCRIIGREMLARGIFGLWLDAGEMARTAAPGQFIHIKCGEELLLRRPISICEISGGELRIVFQVKGGGTAWLSEREAGEDIDVLGPLGKGFTVPKGRVLIAGGGIGVPPLLALAKAADGADAALGFKSASASILIDQFREACGRVDMTSDDGTIGEKGLVHEAVRRRLSEGEYSLVCACGPVPMLKAVAAAAAERGVACEVSLEERMGCGVGACLVCACKTSRQDGSTGYSHVCKDGPVFDAGKVIWNEQT